MCVCLAVILFMLHSSGGQGLSICLFFIEFLAAGIFGKYLFKKMIDNFFSFYDRGMAFLLHIICKFNENIFLLIRVEFISGENNGAPVFCTSSGDPLSRIYYATGDLRYAGLMRDIDHVNA